MVALPETYNTADLQSSGGKLPLIPDGKYQAIILSSEMRDTKNKDGQYLQLNIVITQGQYEGTEFVERLNIINKSELAKQIAYTTLARISEAVGMTKTPGNSNDLHNKPFILEVRTKKGEKWTDREGVERDGSDRSEIYKYHPMANPGAAAAQSGPAQSITPPWSK